MDYLTSLFPDQQVTAVSTTRHTTLEQALKKFELDELPLVEMEQVHGDKIAIVDKAKTQTLKGVDAVLTTLPNVVLASRSADCLPILIYHPSGLIGAVHCGRASTDLGLLKKVLEMIKDKYKVTKDLKIWFGPAICERCYQIDEATDLHYKLIRKNFQQVLEVFPDGQADVSPSNFCTFHQNENFFSYRKEGKDVGRNYSLIARLK
jgi:YfiH family protein